MMGAADLELLTQQALQLRTFEVMVPYDLLVDACVARVAVAASDQPPVDPRKTVAEVLGIEEARRSRVRHLDDEPAPRFENAMDLGHDEGALVLRHVLEHVLAEHHVEMISRVGQRGGRSNREIRARKALTCDLDGTSFDVHTGQFEVRPRCCEALERCAVVAADVTDGSRADRQQLE